jgi:hypothetical protein
MEVMLLIQKTSRPGLTGSENPHIHREVVRDSPKVNVWWLNEGENYWAILLRGSHSNGWCLP